MSAYDYCRNKVALPGSSLYYSVLFAAPDLRATLVALHALAEELDEIADGHHDEAVARAKLGWWAEELARAAALEPRHPVTRVLAEPFARRGIDAHRFAGVLEAAHEHARRGGHDTLDALEHYHERMAEVTGCMAAELCGFRDPATPEVSRLLGVGLALTDRLRLPRDGRPTTGLSPEILADRAQAHLARYLGDLPAEDRGAQRNRRALAEMTLAQLRAMGRAGAGARARPVGVTPLRKLWIAWKHRRQ